MRKLFHSIFCAMHVGIVVFAAVTSFPAAAQETQLAPSQQAQYAENLWLEFMTWPEVATALKNGYQAVIVPTAGIEQNGPHMQLNKHQLVLHYTAPRIAATLGNTLIAPVIDFVPEGNVNRRDGHMAFPGTISIPPRIFSGILEHTARSLHAHGFAYVFFIGDSGGNQEWQERVAKELQEEGLAVHHIGGYYANAQQEAILAANGYSAEAIGAHAGLRDTSELIAAMPDKSALREQWMIAMPKDSYDQMGAYGDLTKANRALGAMLLKVKIEQAVMEICAVAPTLPGCRQVEEP